MSWLDVPLRELPFVVLDLEATGLDAHRDRVVELAVVEAVPGQELRLAFDTLVDPQRAMAATEIHGLGDWDVAGAPTFPQVAPALLHAFGDRLLVAHNAELDLRLLGAELSRCGMLRAAPPHLCTLRLARALGSVRSYELSALCDELGVPHRAAHAARHDAMAAAALLRRLLEGLARVGMGTLRALAEARPGLLDSLEHPSWPEPSAPSEPPVLQPRQGVGRHYPGHLSLRRYRDEVLGAVHDLEISEDELARIRGLRESLELSPSQTWAMHARVFSEYVGRFIDDDRLDPEEIEGLWRLSTCLATLGWAPGEPAPS
ncbi:3'-5' exonuclease [Paraliomyxa miuraensis]|uniref:3'-5' exonuclease n=1 Tax=Paraliomyxa miuraensis TaxID=376150 RepID=UPI002256C71C|nr:3'-5' exonuclease [Paraliomyxa miuraensis]MCX4239505.1 3'-5' exonuclease [Paraliomyxa miuraensis]